MRRRAGFGQDRAGAGGHEQQAGGCAGDVACRRRRRAASSATFSRSTSSSTRPGARWVRSSESDADRERVAAPRPWPRRKSTGSRNPAGSCRTRPGRHEHEPPPREAWSARSSDDGERRAPRPSAAAPATHRVLRGAAARRARRRPPRPTPAASARAAAGAPDPQGKPALVAVRGAVDEVGAGLWRADRDVTSARDHDGRNRGVIGDRGGDRGDECRRARARAAAVSPTGPGDGQRDQAERPTPPTCPAGATTGDRTARGGQRIARNRSPTVNGQQEPDNAHAPRGGTGRASTGP